ncbi:MAG TPA: ankyrin repeat domain-containing protein [Methylotenera sp.]|nr:ankyrin repeat domain-containing protein [Methylotenera sp.]
MAYIPSLEETLSQIRQSIGLERHPQEKRFSDFELNLRNHIKEAQSILNEIFDALNMDEQDRRDSLGNLMEWAGFHKALELRVWTGNASQQQVLWHMLAYSYAPALARRLAFWSIANIQHDLPPIDAGMPGGKFWFLPQPDKNNANLEMPVRQVINWLLDLLGDKSVNRLEDYVENINLNNEKLTNSDKTKLTIRTLHYWRKNGLPKSAKKIDDFFPDAAALNFEGSFSPKNTPELNESFDAALNFVKTKNLTNSEKLHDEIPMAVARLETIFNGSAPDDEKETFVKNIAMRYSIPEMHIIRQRLKIARMMQDGYERLLKFLCPDVAVDCADPAKNKLLQIVGLFETVYNLTIQAYQNADSAEDQDAWFESHLAPWDESDLLLSITPSLQQSGYALLSERLTRKFMSLEPDDPLEDLIPWDLESAAPIIQRRISLIKQQQDEEVRLARLRDRMRAASPWRALLEEDNFWVLSQLAHQDDLSQKLQELVLKRMRELAGTEGRKVCCNLIELGTLLNSNSKNRPKNIKQRIKQLFDESEHSSGFDEWKAPLLCLRAKHNLFQNDFEDAIKDFRAALDACSERAFGGLRGEIARDGFASELAKNGFIPQNQEVYYRNIVAYMEFPDGAPSFEDAAVECENFFWSTLYQPYSDVERLVGRPRTQHEALLKDTVGLIAHADWNGLRVWLQKNAKNFHFKNIKEARRNSVLLSWIKFLNHFEKTLPHFRAITPIELQREVRKVEQHMKNWRTAIAILLEAWPEQAKISDFKGQTPLMLVADNGDVELTKLLTPLSDVNAQDYKGRTALNAAVTGGSSECVSMILLNDHLDELKVTFEGNTALHMAVRFGFPEIVNLIHEQFPVLADKVNKANQTPKTMAQDILDNLTSWKEVMLKQNRKIGSEEDFTKAFNLFSDS